MARISKIPLDHKTYRQILDTLDLILGKSKKDEVRQLLFSLLGKNERIMICKRFTAILLLNQGYTIADICRRLNLTRQTVSRLKSTRNLKSLGFDIAIKKVNKERLSKEINTILLSIAKEAAITVFTHRIRPPKQQ